MKKALVVLLAIAMIFTFATATIAADYSDMANTSKATQDAVNRLSGLGVIDGYTDGTFGPDNNIRRDEFAKIAAIAAGFGSSADAMKNQATGYTDAAAGIWSTGYINIVSAQGYMKGYNGAFSPAANITNAEVLTTVLRMYGYNDNLVGPWPVNYVNQAVKDGLTDDVANFSSGNLATRGDVAIMVSAALNQPMMEYSKDTESFKAKQYAEVTTNAQGETTKYVNKTLAQIAFGGEVAENVKITAVATDAYNAADGLQYNINTGAYTADAKTVVNGANFYDLAGKYATITYDKNDKATVITVTSKHINFTTAEQVSATKIKLDGVTYTLATSMEKNELSSLAVGKKMAASDINEKGAARINPDGKVDLIDLDKNNGASWAGSFVTKVDTAKEKIEMLGTSKTWKELTKLAIFKDGEMVGPAALEAGDVLTYKAGVVVVGKVAATGAVGKNDGTKVAIGDAKYVMAATMDFVELDGTKYAVKGDDIAIDNAGNKLVVADGLYGKEVSIIKNADNSINMVIYGAADTSTYYGVMMGINKTNGDANWGTATKVNTYSIFGEDGTVKEYALEADYKKTANATDFVLGDVVKFTLNKAGEIVAIADVIGADGTKALGAKLTATVDVVANTYINDTNAGKMYPLADDVVIYNLKDVKGDLAVEKMTASALLAGDVQIANLAAGVTGNQSAGSPAETGKYFLYVVNTDGEVEFVALTAFGASDSNYSFGLVEAKSAYEGKYFVTFAGDATEHQVKDATEYGKLAAGKVVVYQIADSKIVVTGDAATNSIAGPVNNTFTSISVVNGQLVNNVRRVAEDAVVYTYNADTAKYEVGSYDDVEVGAKIKVLKQNNATDKIATIIMVQPKVD